jgi:hypothetical protein
VYWAIVEASGQLISVLAGAGSLGFVPLIRRSHDGPEGTFFALYRIFDPRDPRVSVTDRLQLQQAK